MIFFWTLCPGSIPCRAHAGGTPVALNGGVQLRLGYINTSTPEIFGPKCMCNVGPDLPEPSTPHMKCLLAFYSKHYTLFHISKTHLHGIVHFNRQERGSGHCLASRTMEVSYFRMYFHESHTNGTLVSNGTAKSSEWTLT